MKSLRNKFIVRERSHIGHGYEARQKNLSVVDTLEQAQRYTIEDKRAKNPEWPAWAAECERAYRLGEPIG